MYIMFWWSSEWIWDGLLFLLTAFGPGNDHECQSSELLVLSCDNIITCDGRVTEITTWAWYTSDKECTDIP